MTSKWQRICALLKVDGQIFRRILVEVQYMYAKLLRGEAIIEGEAASPKNR